MNQPISQAVLQKNQALIDMVIARVRRDHAEDVALIGLTGSFAHGDAHEKSDLDLIIISKNDRAQALSHCFILDDVGYDLYCTPWEPRIEVASRLEGFGVSSLVDLKILWYASEDDLQRFEAYREAAKARLAAPSAETAERAQAALQRAKAAYGDLMMASDLAEMRRPASEFLYCVIETMLHLNNTYLKRGLSQARFECMALVDKPGCFKAVSHVLAAYSDPEHLRGGATALLRSLVAKVRRLSEAHRTPIQPTADAIRGIYEEFYSNYYHKIVRAAQRHDADAMLITLCCAQNYVDEIAAAFGFDAVDLFAHYDPHDFSPIVADAEHLLQLYEAAYHAAGIEVCRYDSVEALAEVYLAER